MIKKTIRLFSNKLFFTNSHEWIKINTDTKTGTLGISDYAQNELGDIIIIEFPENGSKFKSEDSLGTIESTKSVSDYYSPIDMEVIENNIELENDYSVVNSNAEESWFIKFKYENDNFDHLLNKEQYDEFLKTL